jgi:hypothetical protein
LDYLAAEPIFYARAFVENHKELFRRGKSVLTILEPEDRSGYEVAPEVDRTLLRIWVEIDCQGKKFPSICCGIVVIGCVGFGRVVLCAE